MSHVKLPHLLHLKLEMNFHSQWNTPFNNFPFPQLTPIQCFKYDTCASKLNGVQSAVTVQYALLLFPQYL